MNGSECSALADEAPAVSARSGSLDFYHVEGPERHSVRAKSILATHPEVRQLIGRNPWTAVLCWGIIAFQVAVAVAVGHLGASGWIVAIALGWLVGAFANHSLYVIIHDAAHDLVFRRRSWNRIVLLCADLPNLAPGAIAFRAYHLQHHSHLGETKRDPDLPTAWERRLFGQSMFGKAVWIFLFPLMQALRSIEVGGSKLRDVWFVFNILANAAFALTIFLLFGWTAILYLACSFWFSVGFHPLGARWIQEHFTLDPGQGTNSYYGRLNVLALNIGYHNEHHDFPSIPWNRLPELKKTAPEFYEKLMACKSWSGLLWRFICDSRYSLSSRVVRN